MRAWREGVVVVVVLLVAAATATNNQQKQQQLQKEQCATAASFPTPTAVGILLPTVYFSILAVLCLLVTGSSIFTLRARKHY